MGLITPKFKFGFVLRDGPPNIERFPEAASQGFIKGDPVSIATGALTQFTTPYSTAATSSIETGILGIAAADASGTTGAYCPVYVISPAQQWEAHCKRGVKPSTKATYYEGVNCKLNYHVNTAYTLSDGNGNTNKTAVAAWFVDSTAASAGGGVVIMRYRRGEEGTKGGRMLVRFASHAGDGQY